MADRSRLLPLEDATLAVAAKREAVAFTTEREGAAVALPTEVLVTNDSTPANKKTFKLKLIL